MKQLAQAQEALKTAVAATGAADLQAEVARLQARLAQEREEHQRQIEALTPATSAAGGAPAEPAQAEAATLSRVRHLEWQIESMQVSHCGRWACVVDFVCF